MSPSRRLKCARLTAGRRGSGFAVGSAYLEIANLLAKPQTVQIDRCDSRKGDGWRQHTSLAAGEAYRQIVPLDRQGDPALHAHVDAPRERARC